MRNGNKLAVKTIALFALSVVMLGAVFFLPAGTFDYWQAWIYLAVLFIPMLGVMMYLLKNDPALLERRLKAKEKASEQKTIIKLASLVILIAFILPGFDKRYGWSHLPVWAVILADVLVLTGYGIFFLVLKENSYAARTVEVESDQKVISSGPYAIVRHPMYVGVLLMYTLSPAALGSWISVLPALLIIPVLVLRILDEEKILLVELKGYGDYMQKTRYRLIPGVW